MSGRHGDPRGVITPAPSATPSATPDGALARAVLDALPLTVWTVDPAGRVTSVNRSWARFAADNGAPALADQAVGSSVWDAVGDDTASRQQLERGMALLTTGQASVVRWEFPCNSPDEERVFLMQLTALRDLGTAVARCRRMLDLDADPAAVSAMMAAAAQLPWLRPATVAQLGDGPVTDTGGLVPPSGPGGLEPAGLADVAAAVDVREDLAGAVVGDADAVLAPWDAAIARTGSAAWRDDPEALAAAAADLRTTTAQLLERVTLLAPAEGTYSLASRDAPLVLTVLNDLPFALGVRLEVQSRGNALSVGDISDQVLGPQQRTTLQVPTEVRQSGRFSVAATLTTPDGVPLGEPVRLQVQSTAYGSISVIITIGAAALLGLLFLRRLVRFLLRRRRGTPGDGDDDLPGGPAPEGAAVPLPPTRSPV